MAPEPDPERSEPQTTAIVFPADSGSSGSDPATDDEVEHAGYQLLPQEPEQLSDIDSGPDTIANGSSFSVSDSADEKSLASSAVPMAAPILPNVPQGAQLDSALGSFLQSDQMAAGGGGSDMFNLPEVSDPTCWTADDCLWNEPRPRQASSINLDTEQTARIKAAMSGFTLPPAQQPAWAHHVPEARWKQKLMDDLHSQPGQGWNSQLGQAQCHDSATDSETSTEEKRS